MTANEQTDHYVYRLKHTERSTMIPISDSDHRVLLVYKNVLKKPMTAIIHEWIGIAAKCWEEKHNKRIPLLEERVMDLEERLHIAVRINTEYIRRYGCIHRRES